MVVVDGGRAGVLAGPGWLVECGLVCACFWAVCDRVRVLADVLSVTSTEY